MFKPKSKVNEKASKRKAFEESDAKLEKSNAFILLTLPIQLR